LAAHRRHRDRRRGRLLLDRRPGEGAHQVQGLPGPPGRARGAARLARGHLRRRRDPAPRRGGRRDPQGVRRRGPRQGRDAGERHGVRQEPRLDVQAGAPVRDRRRDPEVAVGEDLAPRAQGTRDRRVVV
ncbi:MAG: Long-chain-fatty-acid--CoA ligase, partial [uncultured Solirubrobacteraceae bacterium]